MIQLISLIVGLLAGAGIVFLLLKNRKSTKVERITSAVVLEAVKPVCKLVTMEGAFSEVLEHNEKTHLMFGLLPKSKKAIVIMQATAHIGFDLQKLEWEVDEAKQRLRIKSFPAPELIALDHQARFYDKSSSALTRFSIDDDNRMLDHARTVLKDKIAESKLIEEARQQTLSTLEMMSAVCSSMGWTLDYNKQSIPTQVKALETSNSAK